MGYKAIIIFGNPAYYHRFGFENAANFEISTAEGANLLVTISFYSPTLLLAAVWLVRNSHLNQAKFQRGAQIIVAERWTVLKSKPLQKLFCGQRFAA
nr:hypothetical protein [Desulfosporosinus sp. BICA1-9]